MRHALLIFVLCSFSLACAADLPPTRTDALYESVFRKLYADCTRAGIKPTLCFLKLPDRPIDSVFLARLSDLPVRVEGSDKCQLLLGRGYEDKTTHQQGVLFQIREVTWRSDSIAVVDAGYESKELLDHGFAYNSTRNGDHWITLLSLKNPGMWSSSAPALDPTPLDHPGVASQEIEAIQELLFRKLFDDSALERHHKAWFLSVSTDKGPIDPSDALLKRLSVDFPLVCAGSRSELDDSGQTFDKTTHEYGDWFYLRPIVWYSDTLGKVEIGCHSAMLQGSSVEYWIRRVDGKWTLEPTGKQSFALQSAQHAWAIAYR